MMRGRWRREKGGGSDGEWCGVELRVVVIYRFVFGISGGECEGGFIVFIY